MSVDSDSQPAIIELIRSSESWHPYPWIFAITHNGNRRVFCGVPNQCKTAGQALRRANQRLKWLDELRACVDDAIRLWRRFGREWLFESRPRGKAAARGVGPYTPSGLRALFRVTHARAGVEDVRLHDLRRKAGSDVEEAHAQALLGHGDAKTTKRHYRAKPARVKPAK